MTESRYSDNIISQLQVGAIMMVYETSDISHVLQNGRNKSSLSYPTKLIIELWNWKQLLTQTHDYYLPLTLCQG